MNDRPERKKSSDALRPVTPLEYRATPGRSEAGPANPDALGPIPPSDPPPAGPARAVDPEPRPAQEPGRLVRALVASKRHPVLVFGTSTSGKSTLLVSLFHCLGRNGEVRASLGEPIFDLQTQEGTRAQIDAQELFERRVDDFDRGKVTEPSQYPEPFFVPVNIRVQSSGDVARFAFLEGKGEWFNPSEEDRGSLYRNMRPEIVEVLRHYDGPLSVIYAAPVSVEEKESPDTGDSDRGLNGAIAAYERYRQAIDQDFHLFLLTKWDHHAPPLDTSSSFSRVRAAEVDGLLTERYARAWKSFQNLHIPTAATRRFYMQYSAGRISDGKVWTIPQRHAVAYDHYRRTLWNWLYGNATQQSDDRGRPTWRGELFPETMPGRAPRPTFRERITSFFYPAR